MYCHPLAFTRLSFVNLGVSALIAVPHSGCSTGPVSVPMIGQKFFPRPGILLYGAAALPMDPFCIFCLENRNVGTHQPFAGFPGKLKAMGGIAPLRAPKQRCPAPPVRDRM